MRNVPSNFNLPENVENKMLGNTVIKKSFFIYLLASGINEPHASSVKEFPNLLEKESIKLAKKLSRAAANDVEIKIKRK